MGVWVELFIIGWVNMFSVGWVDVYILSLAGAATSMSFVATRLLSRQKYACRDNNFCCNETFFEADILILIWTFVATSWLLSRQRQHTFVSTKKKKKTKQTNYNKIILVAAPASDNMLGSAGFLAAEQLTCLWSSELTGIFRVEWIDIFMVGWLTCLCLAGLTLVSWFLYSFGELVCL